VNTQNSPVAHLKTVTRDSTNDIMTDELRKRLFQQIHSMDSANTEMINKLSCFKKEEIIGEQIRARELLTTAGLPLAGGLLILGTRDYLTRLLNTVLDEHDNRPEE